MSIPYAEVIGDPISHSKSPLIHRFWLKGLGLEGDYRAVRVSKEKLRAYLVERRSDPDWRGCNVTMPLKEAVLDHIDDLNEEAGRLGAVNCIARRASGQLYGTNFDSEAVLQSLVSDQWSGRAVLVGNGGAARAALWALPLLGFDEILVLSRDPAKAAAMAEQLGIEVCTAPLSGQPECSLLINATPLGMAGFPPLPISLDAMPEGAAVFEMIYNPLITALVAAARNRGLRVFDGLTMLIEQASMSFVSFFGSGIDEERRTAVRAVLTV